jgi:hypothetical protein
MTRNKKIGIGLILSPWIIGLFLIIGFVLAEIKEKSLLLRHPSTTEGGAIIDYVSPELDQFYRMKYILEYAKIGNLLYLFVGTGLGIYFLVKKESLSVNSDQVVNKN